MEPLYKQAIGIDMSHQHFVARLYFVSHTPGKLYRRNRKKFANTPTGYAHFVSWIKKYGRSDLRLDIAMEATGTYHEGLAYHLHDLAYRVIILLPNKVKGFAKSLNEVSKSDAIDADIIGRMAAERDLGLWQPLSPNLVKVKSLTRQRQDLVDQRTRTKNQLHAIVHAVDRPPSVAARYEELISYFNQLIADVEQELKRLIDQDAMLKPALLRLCTINGIGWITAAIILGETDGFKLFKNRAQLVKYAGFDIIKKQSGSSINGPNKISKRGNSHIRAALYMPAMSAIKHQGIFQALYERLYQRKQNGKAALVAVQRKLLTTMFALHRKEVDYDWQYYKKLT